MTENTAILGDQRQPSAESQTCEFHEEYVVVVNGKEYGPFKHVCVLQKNHSEEGHRCSFGKVIGKHNPEYGDRMSIGIFAEEDGLHRSSLSIF